MANDVLLLCQYEFCDERSGEEKHKWEKRTQFFWYSLSYLSVYLSNHVCSSCSSTFRAKIHWNVLVLSAVYRKLLNYKMVNKIYFKDQRAAVFFGSWWLLIAICLHTTQNAISMYLKCILPFLVQSSLVFWWLSHKKTLRKLKNEN